jgi:hypothetical protein
MTLKKRMVKVNEGMAKNKKRKPIMKKELTTQLYEQNYDLNGERRNTEKLQDEC